MPSNVYCNRARTRSRPISRVIIAGMLAIASISAFSSEKYPKPIQEALDAGVEVVHSFPAASGLTGWVLSQDGHHSIVFTTGDNKTLLIGTLIGEGGENLSDQYESKFFSNSDTTTLFQSLEKSSYVVEGATTGAKSLLYVFVDANCPYCHYTWKALQPYEKAGLQVRWVLVDTLGPTSMPKAIEVLAAPDQTAAFRHMEERHGKSWTASPMLSATLRPDIADKIRRNGQLMRAFQIAGTPGVIWKDADGKVRVQAGMPRLSEIPRITGLPQQPIDDPELAKFR